ncbi:Unknown protein, partial [Striga hermonthica]
MPLIPMLKRKVPLKKRAPEGSTAQPSDSDNSHPDSSTPSRRSKLRPLRPRHLWVWNRFRLPPS